MTERGSGRAGGKSPAPYRLGDPKVRELREILAQTYFNQRLIVDLLNKASVSPASYNLEGSAHLIWGDLLVSAYNRAELDTLLNTVAADPAAKRWWERILDLRSPSPSTDAEGYADDDRKMERPNAREDELIIGKRSTLLDVAFLARGVQMAPAVVRLTARWGGDGAGNARKGGYGTGFLISEKRILTNHHVLFDASGQSAEQVNAWFQYQLDVDGSKAKVEDCPCEVSTITGDAAHDWAIIELSSAPRSEFKPVPLAPPSKPLEEGDRVYIIQHPGGGYKQIGMHHNVVTLVNRDRIQYMTDTEAGSSGSPVFNEQWELVALHHRWTMVDRTAGKGGYRLDDGSDEVDYRNQGIRIERVLEGLAKLGTGA